MTSHDVHFQVATLMELSTAKNAGKLRFHVTLEPQMPPQMIEADVGFAALMTIECLYKTKKMLR